MQTEVEVVVVYGIKIVFNLAVAGKQGKRIVVGGGKGAKLKMPRLYSVKKSLRLPSLDLV